MEHEVEAGNGTELEEAAGLDARGAAQIMAQMIALFDEASSDL